MVNSIRNIYKKQATKRAIILLISFVVFSALYTLFAYHKISTNTNTLISQKDSLYKAAFDKKSKELIEYSNEQTKEKGELVWISLSNSKNREIFDEEFNSNFDQDIISYNVLMVLAGIVIYGLIGSVFFLAYKKPPLYCPYCYKTILPKSIVPFICPFCKTKNILFRSLYNSCENISCQSVIPAIQCPHCREEIGLLTDYDIKKINEKRYGKKTKI